MGAEHSIFNQPARQLIGFLAAPAPQSSRTTTRFLRSPDWLKGEGLTREANPTQEMPTSRITGRVIHTHGRSVEGQSANNKKLPTLVENTKLTAEREPSAVSANGAAQSMQPHSQYDQCCDTPGELE